MRKGGHKKCAPVHFLNFFLNSSLIGFLWLIWTNWGEKSLKSGRKINWDNVPRGGERSGTSPNLYSEFLVVVEDLNQKCAMYGSLILIFPINFLLLNIEPFEIDFDHIRRTFSKIMLMINLVGGSVVLWISPPPHTHTHTKPPNHPIPQPQPPTHPPLVTKRPNFDRFYVCKPSLREV